MFLPCRTGGGDNYIAIRVELWAASVNPFAVKRLQCCAHAFTHKTAPSNPIPKLNPTPLPAQYTQPRTNPQHTHSAIRRPTSVSLSSPIRPGPGGASPNVGAKPHTPNSAAYCKPVVARLRKNQLRHLGSELASVDLGCHLILCT